MLSKIRPIDQWHRIDTPETDASKYNQMIFGKRVKEIQWRNDLMPKQLGTGACVKSLQSCLTLCDPMDCSLPGSSVLGFSRQAYWSGLPGTPSGDLPDPGIEPVSLMSPSLAGGFFTTSATYEAQILTCLSLKKKKKRI